MIDIRIIGTGIEIEKAIECLKQNYQIGSISKLYPLNNRKFRCYIRISHKMKCKLCQSFNADEETGLCASCLETVEDD